MNRSWPLLTAGLLAACAAGNPDEIPRERDAGPPDAGAEDGGAGDAGVDAGAPTDAGAGADAGAPDAGPPDAGAPDAGPPPGPCGVEPCGVWLLRDDAAAWDRYTAPSGPFAPGAPVQAAFDVESLGIAYVLTGSTYHVLRLSDRAWTSAGTRDDLFPQASGVALVSASSVPASHGGDPDSEGLQLAGAGTVYVYVLDVGTRAVTFDSAVTDFGEAWTSPDAPSRTAIRADFLDITNEHGWNGASPMDLCGAGATTVGPYIALLTETRVHLHEAGVCFEFSASVPRTSFPPLARANAPSAAEVAAAFYNQGDLWVLAP